MKIYFAHPCFTNRQKEFKKSFLEKLSAALSQKEYSDEIVIIDPFDYTPNVENDAAFKLKAAPAVMRECIRLLEEADIIIVLADGNDTGTAFEAGYAHAVNKPVILISKDSCSAANAMLLGAAAAAVNDVLDDTGMETLAGKVEEFLRNGRTLHC